MRERTYKQIEASRNRRLWVTQVAMPVASMAVMVGVTLYNNNLQFRYAVNEKLEDVKNFFHKDKKKD